MGILRKGLQKMMQFQRSGSLNFLISLVDNLSERNIRRYLLLPPFRNRTAIRLSRISGNLDMRTNVTEISGKSENCQVLETRTNQPKILKIPRPKSNERNSTEILAQGVFLFFPKILKSVPVNSWNFRSFILTCFIFTCPNRNLYLFL